MCCALSCSGPLAADLLCWPLSSAASLARRLPSSSACLPAHASGQLLRHSEQQRLLPTRADGLPSLPSQPRVPRQPACSANTSLALPTSMAGPQPVCKPPSRAGVSAVSAVCGFSLPWLFIAVDFSVLGLSCARPSAYAQGPRKSWVQKGAWKNKNMAKRSSACFCDARHGCVHIICSCSM